MSRNARNRDYDQLYTQKGERWEKSVIKDTHMFTLSKYQSLQSFQIPSFVIIKIPKYLTQIENNSKMFVSKALCNARRVLLCRGKPCSALLKVMQVPEDLGIEATAYITTHVPTIPNGVFHR